MAEEKIKASVWKECTWCCGYGANPRDYEFEGGYALCVACGGTGGHYIKFTVTPDGAVPTAYLPGE